MGKIHVLDQDTINQIAAGEVVDRPSSVVKEMVENAIDAGASSITVEIKDGGLSLIRITDNGCGIDPDDIKCAFMPHATSKIKDAADLVSIGSLGFRGEALSSIAAVSKVELITKTQSNITGICYKIEGGAERLIEEVGAPDGTTFIVRDIFYNTPARRKFLKSAQTEGLYISELMEKIAMSRPDISFRLIAGGQTKLSTIGNGKLKDVIYGIYGKEIAANLINVKLKLAGLSISGYVGKPVINRSNRTLENYFVNGRYVKCKVISKAIEEAYKPYMMQHKYPFTAMTIDILPELLDVNVHPSKMELRFSQEDVLYRELTAAIASAVGNQDLVVQTHLPDEAREFKKQAPSPVPATGMTYPDIKENAEVKSVREEKKPAPGAPVSAAPFPGESIRKIVAQRFAEPFEVRRRTDDSKAVSAQPAPTQEAKQMEMFDDCLLSQNSRSRHRVIGQLFETYWLIEFDGRLFIIDQHAAHEKVLYERTMKSLKDKDVTSQLINPPVVLSLTERQTLALKNNMEFFSQLGFDISDYGGGNFSVSALPANLFSLNQVDLLMELIDDFSDELGRGRNQTIHDKVASISCKAAVKGNMKLSIEQANKLIDELLTLDNPYACPHGRPTIISMSKYEIDKKFRRIL